MIFHTIIALAIFFQFFSSSVLATCDATDADRWKYLWQNPSLEVRQLIAVGVIKEQKIKTIIEIGGYCTPVCRYMPGIKYINIDPYVNSNPAICTNATLIKKGFEELRLTDLAIEEPFALVAVGIFWENLKKTKDLSQIKFLNEILARASMVVAESTYPVKWVRDQSRLIEDLSNRYGLKKKIDIDIDIQGKRPMNNVFYRHMTIFTKH